MPKKKETKKAAPSPKAAHGGARKGAGRPPSASGKRHTIYIRDEHWNRFTELCDEWGMSQGDTFGAMVEAN